MMVMMILFGDDKFFDDDYRPEHTPTNTNRRNTF